MRLSRRKFWIVLHGAVLLLFLAYQLMWLVAGVRTEGYVLGFSEGSKDFPVESMHVEYKTTKGPRYTTFLYDQDVLGYRTGQVIEVSYLPFARGSVRLPGFTAGDFVAAISYLMILFVSGLIFLMPNYLIGKESYFMVSRRLPFIRYHNGKPATHRETMSRIVRANLIAGYIEKFMLPFVGSAVAALFLYLFTWSVAIVVCSLAAGAVLGIIRAIRWKKTLDPGDEELEVLDVLSTSDDTEGC